MAMTETKDSEAKAPTKGNNWIHAVLLYAAVFGGGIISGYGLFYSIFVHRCESYLDGIARENNNTVASLNELYQQAVEDNKLCTDDESRSQEIFELKGRLEAQSDLVSSHRTLIDKHKISTTRLEELKPELERKEAELFVIQKRIELNNREKDELENDLRELKKSVQKELSEKTEAIADLKSSIEAFQSTEREMLKHVQSRHGVMSRQLYVVLHQMLWRTLLYCARIIPLPIFINNHSIFSYQSTPALEEGPTT